MAVTRFTTLALLMGAALPFGCRNATSIELVIETDLACEDVKVVTTSIRSGKLSDYETKPVTAQTTRCDATTGRIGSLVLVPSDDDSAEVAVKLVTARKNVTPEQCEAQPGPDCIVAHRVVRFVPHESLVLPVAMKSVCAGKTCGEGETCLDGACVPAARNWEFSCIFCDKDAAADASAPPSPSSQPPAPEPPSKDDKDKGKDGKSGKN